MTNLSKTHEEQLKRMDITDNQFRFFAHDIGYDFDDKYDNSFGRAERVIADEWNKLETNKQ